MPTERATGDAQLLRSFGERVRRLREAAELSQEDLADLAGLHRTYVSSLERGERNVGLLNIHAIAGALGVTAAELFLHTKAD